MSAEKEPPSKKGKGWGAPHSGRLGFLLGLGIIGLMGLLVKTAVENADPPAWIGVGSAVVVVVVATPVYLGYQFPGKMKTLILLFERFLEWLTKPRDGWKSSGEQKASGNDRSVVVQQQGEGNSTKIVIQPSRKSR